MPESQTPPTDNFTRPARKITVTLFTAQSLGSAALIVTGTVNAIVGAELSGNPAWAGVPTAILQIGTAIASLVVGVAMDKTGRRGGLSAGLAVGVIGSGVAATSIAAGTFTFFLTGLILIGVARAAMQLGRFAAAEVHPPKQRGRAISNVVIGGTVGSVVGPLLVSPSGRWASNLHQNELVGPYLIAAIVLALASLVVFAGLRPDPRELGRAIAKRFPESHALLGKARPLQQIFRTPPAMVAVTAMVVGQMVMSMLMGITSLYMKNFQRTLADISIVFSAHTIGMFAFSIVSGRLTDAWGRERVILAGGGILVLASSLAPLSPGVFPLSIALFLLGLGWNLCYVGGSALLSDQLSPEERARTQGANDLMIGLATAAGSFASGLIFAARGYGAMGNVGLAISLIPITFTGWWLIRKKKLVPA